MEARTFKPQPKKKKKAHHKVKNVPVSDLSVTETSVKDERDAEDMGWSAVTRTPRQYLPSQKQHQLHNDNLHLNSLETAFAQLSSSETARGTHREALTHLRSTLAKANRRALFREELLQNLCRLTPSKQAGGLIDQRSQSPPSRQQGQTSGNAGVTGTTLLLDAYTAVASTTNISSPRPRAAQDSLARLHARRAKITQSWRASTARSGLLSQLRRVIDHAGFEGGSTSSVDCICLGLGSLSAEATGWKAVSMWQLVIWEDICSSLFSRASSPSAASASPNPPTITPTTTASQTYETRLVFQDPMFNARDITFLTEDLGYQVVYSPVGYDVLDSLPRNASSQQAQRKMQSVVFAPHFPVRFWPQGVRLGKPLFVIGNGIGDAGHEALLDKIPGRKVMGRAVAMIESLDTEPLERATEAKNEDGSSDGNVNESQEQDAAEKPTSFEYEAEIMRKEIWAREEMELFLRRRTSVKCPMPDECREALWETVIWSPRSHEEEDCP